MTTVIVVVTVVVVVVTTASLVHPRSRTATATDPSCLLMVAV